MMKLNQRLAQLHPWIIALLPVLYLGGRNMSEVPIEQVVLASLVALTVLSAAYWIGRLITQQKEKLLALLSLFLVLAFSYRSIFELVYPFYQHKTVVAWAILTSNAAFFIFALFALKKQQTLEKINQFFGMTSLMMLLIILFNTASNPLFLAKIKKLPEKIQTLKAAMEPKDNHGYQGPITQNVESIHLKKKPDIYYIILDGYARSDILKSYLGYDNSWFEAELKQCGFYIAPRSKSNYPVTRLSLASSLSMDYINPLIKQYGLRTVQPFFDLIRSPRIAAILKNNGYQYITFSSGWGPTNNASPLSDYHFSRTWNLFDTYYQSILAMTPLKEFVDANEAKLRLFILDKIKTVPALSQKPKFVFVHLVMPHEPYLFDREGHFRKERPSKEQVKAAYVDQLHFLNNKVIEIAQSLIKQSSQPPIIIFQSDHGSESSLVGFHSGHPSAEQIKERFPIINAYYGPAEFKSLLYDSITPVNSFKILLEYLSETKQVLHADQNYFQWLNGDELFDVTEHILAQGY